MGGVGNELYGVGDTPSGRGGDDIPFAEPGAEDEFEGDNGAIEEVAAEEVEEEEETQEGVEGEGEGEGRSEGGWEVGGAYGAGGGEGGVGRVGEEEVSGEEGVEVIGLMRPRPGKAGVAAAQVSASFYHQTPLVPRHVALP